MQPMFGDGASTESRSPCGSQFSFASVTCASDAETAAALACSPGLPRTISRRSGSVSCLAQAEEGAPTATPTNRSNQHVRRRTTGAVPGMTGTIQGLTALADGDTRLAMAKPGA